MDACTNGGATAFPYGGSYVAGACNGGGYAHPAASKAVGSVAGCHGAASPFTAIVDMSGNVAEWEDACAGATGAGDLCRRRGGSFADGPTGLRCDADDGAARDATSDTTGFRCCSG